MLKAFEYLSDEENIKNIANMFQNLNMNIKNILQDIVDLLGIIILDPFLKIYYLRKMFIISNKIIQIVKLL